jgi:hypothetical protein
LARSGANSQARANCSAGIILDELETGTVSEATMERIRAMLGGEDEEQGSGKGRLAAKADRIDGRDIVNAARPELTAAPMVCRRFSSDDLVRRPRCASAGGR